MAITFIVNGNTYSLSATDAQGIQAIPVQDRQLLISLLEAIKQQGDVASMTTHRAKIVSGSASYVSSPGANALPPERMGRGDVDALMTRLVMEENRDKKPGMTKQSLYRWVLGIAAVIILLVVIL